MNLKEVIKYLAFKNSPQNSIHYSTAQIQNFVHILHAQLRKLF